MTFSLTVHPLLYAAAIAGSVALLVFLTPRSTTIRSRRMRLLLLALRVIVVAIVLFILAGPLMAYHGPRRNTTSTFYFLVDTSESMGLGRDRSRLTKTLEFIESALDRAGRAIPVAFTWFDSELRIPEEDETDREVAATGEATLLSAALESLLTATADVDVAGIAVCSDGRLQDRDRLGEAIRTARRRGIAISTYTAGTEEKLVNAGIQNCLVARHAPRGSRVPVRVLIHGQDIAEQTLSLRVTDSSDRVQYETQLTGIDGLTEQDLHVTLGDRAEEYRVELSAPDADATEADDSFSFKVDVRDPPVRVLYMEGSNHKDTQWDKWEYEFIEEALLEAGNIEVTILTVDRQVASGGRLFRTDDPQSGYPETEEELFTYDVVICSDINRSIFSPEQLTWTAELVADRGGGFCMIGGYTAFGAGGWDKTLWEQMIPMDMRTLEEGYVMEEFPPVFPAEVRKHPILLLDADPSRNDAILDAHPPFRGTNLVHSAKPAATVLAVHEEREMPIISVQTYGKGRAMAFTSDAAGGWGDYYQTRWGEGEKDNRYYRRFWVNAVRWLAENSSARRHTQLIGTTEATAYEPGQLVRVRGQVLTAKLTEALFPDRVTAGIEGSQMAPAVLKPDRETGEFRGVVKLPERHDAVEAFVAFRAENDDGEVLGEDRVTLRVKHVNKEYSEIRPDPEFMGELARATGGAAVGTAEELSRVLEEEKEEQERRANRYRIPLWDRAWLWALVTLLLSAEWLIRKILRFA